MKYNGFGEIRAIGLAAADISLETRNVLRIPHASLMCMDAITTYHLAEESDLPEQQHTHQN